MRQREVVAYDANHVLIESTVSKDLPQAVVPGSVGEEVFRRICSLPVPGAEQAAGHNARTWKQMLDTREGEPVEVDVSSFTAQGKFRSMWVRQTRAPSSDDATRHHIEHMYIDCVEGSYRTDRAYNYDDNGALLAESMPSKEPQQPAPDTIGEKLVKEACSVNEDALKGPKSPKKSKPAKRRNKHPADLPVTNVSNST